MLYEIGYLKYFDKTITNRLIQQRNTEITLNHTMSPEEVNIMVS